MTQEDKDLLWKDLCARLPYKTYVLYDMDKIFDSGLQCCLTSIDLEAEYQLKAHRVFDPIGIEEARPYLRPMSSMTEEEKVQLSQYACIGEDVNGEFIDEVQRKDCAAYIDWLNAHHFDFRNLIERGLAIAVTEENNPYKNS